MRRIIVVVLLLVAAGTTVLAAPKLTARARLQEVLGKTLALQQKAVKADPEVLATAGLRKEETFRWSREEEAFSDAGFATVKQLAEYRRFRPWHRLYGSLHWSSPVRTKGEADDPYFTSGDAPAVRKLLVDRDPQMRSLAVEVLGLMDQPQDVPVIAAMMDDAAKGAPSLEYNFILNQVAFPGMYPTDEDKSPVITRSWRTQTVGQYARRAVEYMTGLPDCSSEILSAGLSAPESSLNPTTFTTWWKTHSDAKQCLWYWQQHIAHEHWKLDLRLADEAPSVFSEGYHRAEAEWRVRRDGEKSELNQRLLRELSLQSSEVEAKVKLLAIWDANTTDAGSTHVPESPLKLRLTPERLVELLEKKRLWEDVDWDPRWHNAFGSLVRNIALNTRILRRQDVPRLREVYSNTKQVSVLVAISRLLPPAKPSDLDDPDTRDGTLRAGIKTLTNSYQAGQLAAELVDVGLPANWPFLKSAFFAETDHECCIPNVRESIISTVAAKPLTAAKKAALVDLATDERFRILWTQPNASMGDDRYRRGAIAAINAYAGKTVIDLYEEQNLTDPVKCEKTLADVLTKARALL